MMTNQKKPTAGSASANKTNQLSTFSPSNATAELYDRLHAVGIDINNIPYDQGLKRVYNNGDKKGSKNLAIIAHSQPMPTVWVQNHRTGEVYSFSVATTDFKKLSPTELAQQKKAREKQKAEQDKQRKLDCLEGAKKAQKIWATLASATQDLPYLASKHIRQVDRLKRGRGGAVAVPMLKQGEIIGLQFITLSDKKVMGGSCSGGAYFLWNKLPPDPDILYLSESLSTSYAVMVMTGKPCLSCFNAGNLLPVAKKLRGKYPASRLIFACDNDIRQPEDRCQSNTGIIKGIEAAQAVGGEYIVPNIGNNKKCDFWDVWQNASFFGDTGGVE